MWPAWQLERVGVVGDVVDAEAVVVVAAVVAVEGVVVAADVVVKNQLLDISDSNC